MPSSDPAKLLIQRPVLPVATERIATADGLLWAWPMLLWAATFAFVFLLQVKGPVKGEVEQPEPSLSPSISA